MSTTIQTANHPLSREQAKIMGRFDLISRMVRKLHKDEAVIGGIGYTNFDLWAASGTPAGRRAQNFYMLGSMGLAAPIALGVAIAQPDRRVIGLEGLRVADASVMPSIVSANTNMAAIMIGERVAEFMRRA